MALKLNASTLETDYSLVPLKVGRSTWGTKVYGDEAVYLAHRINSDIFRHGAINLAVAIQQGIAEVAIDVKHLRILETEGFARAGILLVEARIIKVPVSKHYPNGLRAVPKLTKQAIARASIYTAPIQHWLDESFGVTRFGDYSEVTGQRGKRGSAQMFLNFSALRLDHLGDIRI